MLVPKANTRASGSAHRKPSRRSTQEHQDAGDRGEQRRRELLHDLGHPVDLRLLPTVLVEPEHGGQVERRDEQRRHHRVQRRRARPSSRADHPVGPRLEVVAVAVRALPADRARAVTGVHARPGARSRRERACRRARGSAAGSERAACPPRRSSAGSRCRRGGRAGPAGAAPPTPAGGRGSSRPQAPSNGIAGFVFTGTKEAQRQWLAGSASATSSAPDSARPVVFEGQPSRTLHTAPRPFRLEHTRVRHWPITRSSAGSRSSISSSTGKRGQPDRGGMNVRRTSRHGRRRAGWLRQFHVSTTSG